MAFNPADVTPFTTVFGRNLIAEIANFVAEPTVVVTMRDLWPLFQPKLPPGAQPYFVASLERADLERDVALLADAAAVVGLGGGQAIDCAKYFAWRRRLPLYQFPTSLSVDAVFGHRAGVRENRLVRYIGWAVPETVYIDYGIVEAAPQTINRAGVGDIFCFITGVMDWRYAERKGRCEPRWPYDDALAQISLAKAEAALAALDDIRELTPRGIRVMVDALQWGGASYHAAGWCPRHIEGVEHYIFYALEALSGKKFLHGQAVCLGLVAGAMMHGQRERELLQAVTRVGVDIRPAAMNIGWDDVTDALNGLRRFVRQGSLPYGIGHDFDVTPEFLRRLRQTVEAAY